MKRLSTLFLFTVMLLLVVGCAGPVAEQSAAPAEAPAQEASSNEETQPAAPASASGTITLYTSESEDQVNEMVADFNRLYPDITVDIFRSGSGEVVAKLQAEMEAGEIQADVIWFADIDFFSKLAADDLLLAYAPQGGENIPAEYHYEGDKFHEVRLIFNTVAYNTALISEPPTGWADLLDPKYQGKVGMPSALYSGAAFNQVGTLANSPDFGWDFYEQLNSNGVVVERGNGAVANKVATGEFAIVQVVDFMARNLKNDGSPVDHIWPEEGALLVPTPIGIINNTDNPEAAQAFLDYMYTDNAQEFFVKQGYVAVVPGASLPEGAPDLADLKVLTVDTGYISDHRDEIRSAFEDMFGTSDTAAAAPAQAPAPASGTITLYTSKSEDQVNEMVADFNRLYPDITVDIFRSGSGEVVAKLQAEMEAGEIQADVIWFADIDFFSKLAADDLLLAYAPQGGENIPAEYHYEGDKFHEVRLIFNTVAYNTALISEPPTGWADLLDPKYQGKVGMPSALYSGAAFNQVGTLANSPDFGWDFYEQLNSNGVVVERGNGAVANKVATGEFAIVQVVDFMARNLKNDGSPVDHIWPEEGALLVPTPIGIINNTDNPEAAQAFLDYMYTDNAQEFFVKQGYVAVVPGASLPEGAPDLADLKVLIVDTGYISDHRDEIRSAFEDMFGTSE